MIALKSKEEIILIKKSAEILSKTQGLIARAIKPGVATKVLDKLAETFIKDNHGLPSFRGYKKFPATLCTSANENVVHGIPSEYRLQEGDIISVDCGVCYKGFHSDMAFTYPVGVVKEEVMQLLKATKEALFIGINEIKVGKRIGDIGHVIQKYVQNKGYSVVRELGGHGIGRDLHEDPEVPNYGKRGSGVKLKQGMVLAIEPMINLGKRQIIHERDGWHVSTLDKKPSAHFEHTIAVSAPKAEILTTYKYIEEVFKF